MKSWISGRKTGNPVRSPFAVSGRDISSLKSGLNLLCSSLRTFTSAAAGLVLLAVFLVPSAAFSQTPVHGDKIINNARIDYAQSTTPATSSVIVTAVVRTPSTIEVLTFAPLLSTAQTVNVTTTAYRAGSSSGPLVNLPAPDPLGPTPPIDLSQPVPLTDTAQIHQGEPLFIRLTDKDQNLNNTVAETVFVTVTNPANGDAEVIRLTETGPNTGVFTGYLPTSNGPITSYSGSISVKDGDILNINYVDSVDGTDTSATTVVVDPYGIVFDTTTGLPVPGATVTLINTTTGLPATVYGDDGVSSFPSTVTSDASGKYRFPFVLSGSYQLQVTPPPGYAFPSQVDTAIIQTLSGNPFTIVPGSRGEVFGINPGPSVRIDIPLDRGSSTFWVQKTAGKDTAGHGDFIPYRLTVTNTSTSVAAGGVQVVDTMPIGFRYRSGSAKLNGVSTGNPTISSDGRTLTFNVGTLAAGASATIDYVVEVTAGTKLGDAINSATAGASSGGTSNNARVTVKIKDDFMRTKSTLMGRVSTGACNDKTVEGPNGVEGVRVYLEDGSFVISDKRGLFHFEGVNPGLHVVQMDLDSLPEGYEAFACTQNSRFAGRAFSQFVETQGGALWRTDFHVRKKTRVAEPPAPPELLKGEIVLQLANAIEEKTVAYKVYMRGSTVPVKAVRLNIILPEGVLYEQGSSKMDGAAITDPLQMEKNKLVFKLNDLPAGWGRQITFRGTPSRDMKAGTLVTQAYLAADGEGETEVLTPPAETILQMNKNEEISQMPDIVLRPHFPVRSAELNDEDRKKLDELADSLSGLRLEKIYVSGHTDNVPIAPQNRIYYIDNQALSLARAKSVGHYLINKLQIPPEKLSVEGKGSDEPIADNKTQAGKALNRRVEVHVTSSRVTDSSNLSVLKELSGEKRIKTVAQKKEEKKDEPVQTKSVSSEVLSSATPEKSEITIKENEG
ncbi:MAG: OmpA family protein, partial [Deltaproteobacteria bacterium]|nr:OmpA family protein [Deltaproteobacteria bacterium]